MRRCILHRAAIAEASGLRGVRVIGTRTIATPLILRRVGTGALDECRRGVVGSITTGFMEARRSRA